MTFYHTHDFKLLNKVFIIMLLLFSTAMFAQKADTTMHFKSDYKIFQKGKFYINWGYNRAWYHTSDIHFTGQGHDFVLYNVVAKDRPSKFSSDYVSLKYWSTPQFNFRFGYYISDKYSISAGWDHMKYVATDSQMVRMYGYLDPTKVSDPLMKTNMQNLNTKYAPDGLYNNIEVQMTPGDFIHYEHTDGLNYASVDLERHDVLWQPSKQGKFGISLLTAIGAGAIVPRTDSHLFGSGRNHYWNIAGWGTSARAGLQINFTKVIYLESDFKIGYLEMINVHTSNHYNIDKAQQHIVFYETLAQLGFRF